MSDEKKDPRGDFPEEAELLSWWKRHFSEHLDSLDWARDAAHWALARRSERDRFRPTEADMNAQERKARGKIEALENELADLKVQHANRGDSLQAQTRHYGAAQNEANGLHRALAAVTEERDALKAENGQLRGLRRCP